MEPLPEVEARRGPGKGNFGNFTAAVRSRKVSDLNADILEGHYSSALCHLANVSFRLGNVVPFDRRSSVFANDPHTTEALNRAVEHLENNQVPVLNPLYQQYLRLYPLPNNPQGIVSREGQNNYLASRTAFNWDYKAFSNRIDWNLSPRHRSFARWSYNYFLEDRGDWTYETARGLLTNGLVRKNIGATIDHVFVQSSRTVWNVSLAFNRFTEGNERNGVQRSFSPTSVGLPAYVEERADASGCTLLPRLDFSDNSQATVAQPVPLFRRRLQAAAADPPGSSESSRR